MAREQKQIAKDFLDDLISQMGFDRYQVYNLIQSLEDCPDLTNVRPDQKGAVRLTISGSYTGDQFWVNDEKRARMFFDQLGSELGVEFLKAYSNSDSKYCAQVCVATDESMESFQGSMKMSDNSHYNIVLTLIKEKS